MGIQKQNLSTGIKIICIINYIFAVLGIIFSIIAIIGGIYFILNGSSVATQIFGFNSKHGTLGSEINSNFSSFYSNFGFIALGVGILIGIISIFAVIVGIKMWKGKNWARISEMILMILWVIIWSIELFKGNFLNLIPIIPALIIFFYLIFSKNVKQFFRNELSKNI